ncbi:MAG: DUF835 domain-containing protein, partial [Thermoplasmatota archaeon]
KTEPKGSEEKLGGKYTDENLISIKKQLEDGSTYVLEDETLDFAYDVFSKLVNTDTKTLCITRKHPEKIQEKYNIGDTDFVWLSTSNESIAIGPQQLDMLSLTIEGFISDEGDTLFIDGLGYLFSNNPVSTITQFLQSIQDQITTRNTKLIFAASPSSLEDKYYNLLNNELNPELISLLEKTQKETDISKEETEDLVDDMQNMVSYLEDEERELEEKVNKLNQQNIPELKEEGISDVVMDAINSLRDEITTLRNRLDEEGSEAEEQGRIKEPSQQMSEEPESREEKIRSIVEEKEETKTEEESEEETTEEGISDEKMRKIIELVEDRIKTEEEEEEIPEEYIEKIIDEVKKELREEKKESESIRETEVPEELEKDTAEKEPEEEKTEIEPEIEEKTVTPEIEEETTTEEESETPTVGDILNTVKREKKEEKTETDTEEEKMKIKEGFHVKGSLESDDDIVLKDRSTVDGDVTSKQGNVIVGKDCTINGKVRGQEIDVSENSVIEEIDAEEDVNLGKNVKVNRIKTEGDVELHQGVEVEEEIEYGEHQLFKGDDIKVGNLIHPVKNEEVVEEQWVSQ